MTGPLALHAQTTGRGPPVVLLHGWGMNLRVFDELRTALAEEHCVTTVDLPGHGRSPWRTGMPAGEQLDALARCVPSGAALVGWSLGGQFALQLAARAAGAGHALVLIASTPRFVRAADWPYGLTPETLQRFGTALAEDADHTLLDFLELQVRGSAAAGSTLATLRAALANHGRAQTAALAAGMQLLEQNDLRSAARTLPSRCLVIAGQYDRITPPQAAEALSQLMPRAQLLTVPRAGHAPFLSHPQIVTDALRDFLRAEAAA